MEAEASLTGLKKTDVNNLTIGMYVAQLDRDWTDTDYPVQGFYIRSRQGIDRLARECNYVFVDPRRYDSSLTDVKLHVVAKPHETQEPVTRHANVARIQPRRPRVYKDTVELGNELEPARTSLEDAVQIMRSCVSKLQATGGFDIDEIERAISPLVESVMRNKSAMAALLRMRALDDYTFSHAISNAVWGAILARQLGFPPPEIDAIALACSLLDIGKVSLPPDLLVQPEPPTPEQWEILRGHVAEGVRLLEENDVKNNKVLLAVQSHHERFDGSGYPAGLAGNEIPLWGRIGAVVDSYDAMISERPYAEARSSYGAVQELQKQSDVLYQREIVDQFIQAIGVFPVGAIVELNTGEVGVVVAQHNTRRLKPKIILLLDVEKNPRSNLVIVDLSTQDTEENATLSWWITRELPKNAYGIDPAKYFL
ncbi:MAG: HD-GYP domain-containing protein [Pseudomonadales bacterium]|jgi:HD-GYP domain-containing protein (c-di-GMP phosphodiesterase class II)